MQLGDSRVLFGATFCALPAGAFCGLVCRPVPNLLSPDRDAGTHRLTYAGLGLGLDLLDRIADLEAALRSCGWGSRLHVEGNQDPPARSGWT